jgi:hypothetical protein
MKGLLPRLFAAAAIAFMVVGSFGAVPTAQAVVSNTLIKGSSPAVYWYASNGKRYVFPNVKTFYTWFNSNDFGRVQVISDYELSQISLGGNVTYRGGAKLVKVTTDPRVYAVSRYGTLRWVTSEYLAAQLYGSNWRFQVEDLPDAYFTNYTMGSPIYSASDFNVSNEYNGVQSPTDNISNLWANPVTNPSYPYPSYPSGYPSYPNYPYYNDSFNGSTYISGSITNRWMSGDQEAITYTATIYNRNTALSNVFIQILDARTGNELGRCSATETCAATLASRDLKNVTIYARAVDQRGTEITSSKIDATYGRSNWYSYPYQPSYPTTFTGSARLNANRTEVIANGSDATTLTVYIDTVSTDIGNVSVKIYRVGDDSEVGSCSGAWSCTSRAVTFTNYGNRHTSEQFYAVLKDQYGRTLPRIYSSLITLRDDTPYYPPVYPPTYPPVYPPIYPPTPPVLPPASFQVTYATVSVSPSYNTCGTDTYTFTGSITATAAGTVRYTWERSDGAWSPEETVYFNGAGTQTVSNTWAMNASYSGWQRLHVISPNDTVSNMATFSHTSDCLWYY